MPRIAGLVLASLGCAFIACAARGLDLPEAADPPIAVDLAVVLAADLGAIDLAPTDLARAEGVLCAGKLCAEGQVCCPLSGVPGACVNAGPGPGLNDCPFGGSGLRCDGPEDCRMGRDCVARLDDERVRVIATYCRFGAGPDAPRVCHDDGDCGPREACTSIETVPLGAAELRVCR